MIKRFVGLLGFAGLLGNSYEPRKEFQDVSYELSGRGFANLKASYNGSTTVFYYHKKVRSAMQQTRKYPHWKTETKIKSARRKAA